MYDDSYIVNEPTTDYPDRIFIFIFIFYKSNFIVLRHMPMVHFDYTCGLTMNE